MLLLLLLSLLLLLLPLLLLLLLLLALPLRQVPWLCALTSFVLTLQPFPLLLLGLEDCPSS